MQAHRCEPLGLRIEVLGDGVGGCDMARVRIGVAQEVGEGDGREGVVVGVGGAVEFDHLCCSSSPVTAFVGLVGSRG